MQRKFAEGKKVGQARQIELIQSYQNLVKKKIIARERKLEEILKICPTRTLSGVAVITVLTKPYPCSGRCLFCPSQNKMPKSYLSNEPAVMRAHLCQFDPQKQVTTRLASLAATGHNTSKIEIIILGGNFSFYPKRYQNWFIKKIFDGLNGKESRNLAAAQAKNEKAKHRCVGLTVEARPDFVAKCELKRFRQLGVTRVEIGVQTVFDIILKLNRRGHGVKETISATKLLKDFGFKVTYHMMPNLPGSNPKLDFLSFDRIFNSSKYCPDQLKIYPTVVVRDAELYKIWQDKKFKPYSEKTLINLLAKIKKIVPRWVRIVRLIRDIPASSILAGNNKTNLRQMMKEKGITCQCIRCREPKEKKIPKNIKLFKEIYLASDGIEYFLSLEDSRRKNIFAFLRLRILSPDSILKILKNSTIIRELHCYGEVSGFGKKTNVQHRGLGKKLVKEAEKISREKGYKKIAAISGIGVRDYWRKQGYRLKNSYMVKSL